MVSNQYFDSISDLSFSLIATTHKGSLILIFQSCSLSSSHYSHSKPMIIYLPIQNKFTRSPYDYLLYDIAQEWSSINYSSKVNQKLVLRLFVLLESACPLINCIFSFSHHSYRCFLSFCYVSSYRPQIDLALYFDFFDDICF